MTAPHPNAHTLMQLLWSIDPMGTGCTANPGMEDEYWSQARDMAEELEKGIDPRTAITEVFDFYFLGGLLAIWNAPRQARPAGSGYRRS